MREVLVTNVSEPILDDDVEDSLDDIGREQQHDHDQHQHQSLPLPP